MQQELKLRIDLILQCFFLEKPWFHGKLEREQAVKTLRSNGMDEG